VIKYNATFTFTGMIGAEKDNENNNKARLNVVISNLHISKGIWYVGLLAATLLLSVALSGEFSGVGSRVYAEEQIYKTQILLEPILLKSISTIEQQGTQQPTNNQTEMQQPSSPQNSTIHA
jgi:hypothetical protein